ncbi:MAG: hypothetical protein FJZ11_00195 [Candidatus Omnitrophica bacterium]|nr:hypothetical protein [Candidatus Omnitrophota bacterium]
MPKIYAALPAFKVFSERFDNVSLWSGFPDEDFSILVAGYGQPKLEINNRIFITAKERGIKSIAVLDNWKGLERFFNVDGAVSENLPDFLAVMDNEVKKILIAMGLPSKKVIVTGHPLIEMIAKEKITADRKYMARKKLGISQKANACLILSENLHPHSYHESCGAACHSLFTHSNSAGVPLWRSIIKRRGGDNLFIVRTHPNEQVNVSGGIRIIKWGQADEMTVLSAADEVFGLTSLLTQFSVACGIPAYNVRPLLARWRPENSYLKAQVWDYLYKNGYLGNAGDIKARKMDHSGAIRNITRLIENG